MRRVLLAGATLACGVSPARRGRTVIYASGADLQSVNPLFTTHPLAKQVQRYVLLTTRARDESAHVPRPCLARRWTWSADGTTLTFRLQPGVRWHDGVATTARDVGWTLNTACDSVTGYPRLSDLANVVSANDADDSTVIVRFSRPERELPDVFTDLAVLPAHLLDSIPRTRLRQAEWNAHPVGNGPFRFVTHESNRRWVFAANPTFPPALGGPPQLARFIVVVVDEPTTKLAALTVGEIDFAGIQPAHAAFVRRNPTWRCSTTLSSIRTASSSTRGARRSTTRGSGGPWRWRSIAGRSWTGISMASARSPTAPCRRTCPATCPDARS